MHATTYKSIEVNRLSIFYREAGSPDAPTVLLLHGFPSSSRMYEPVFTRLADAFHLLTPEYPGFGHSDAPEPTAFDYTFDNLARTACSCRTTADPSDSAWPWPVPIDRLRW